MLFTYLHLAADKMLAEALIRSGAVAIAYETVTDARGGLPLLAPMSEVAGRMAVQVGAHCLEKEQGGIGVLLGGVPGVPAAKVVILGGGVSGTNAARMAMGMEAYVTVIDRSLPRLYELDLQFGAQLHTLFSTMENIEREVTAADLVIGAVLIPGAAAPKLVSRALVRAMKPGAVVVDISIDQGGCFETSRPTTHAAPTYVEEGVVHYCVTNMPGAVARTSTVALNNATLPFVLAIADHGWQRALREDPHLRDGLNICRGPVTHPAVAPRSGSAVHAARATARRTRGDTILRALSGFAVRYGSSARNPYLKPNQAGDGGYGAPSDRLRQRTLSAARCGRAVCELPRARQHRRRRDCRDHRSLPRNLAGGRRDPRSDVGLGQPFAARNPLFAGRRGRPQCSQSWRKTRFSTSGRYRI